MEKKLATANDVVTPDLGDRFYHFKATIYDVLGNLFSWLSTHQGLALIVILIILGTVIWSILRVRKYGKQLEKEVSSKDALIRDQKNKLENLQKKLSDQQGVVSEALFKTIMDLTGYDIDQLKAFFKFLTEIRGNPLQMADTQTNTMPKSQRLAEESDDAKKKNGAKDKIALDTDPGQVIEDHKTEEA
jgi:hypothetical protein